MTIRTDYSEYLNRLANDLIDMHTRAATVRSVETAESVADLLSDVLRATREHSLNEPAMKSVSATGPTS